MDPWLQNIFNQYPERIVGLKHHFGTDPMTTPETSARASYYGVSAAPTLIVGGVDAGWPYSTYWLPAITSRMDVPSPLEFTLGGEYNPSTQSGYAEVEVYVEGSVSSGADHRILWVISENDVQVSGTHQCVTRDFIPDQNGTSVALEQGSTYNFTIDFEVPSGSVADNCYISVIIQNAGTRDVLQADKEFLTDLEPLAAPAAGVSTSSLDFGQVEVGQSADLSLRISSIGELPLVIYDISTNNIYFATDWDESDSLLLVGEHLDITVTFTPMVVATFNRTLTVESNGELIQVMLHGSGVSSAVYPDASAGIPESFALHTPYPNPFNPETTVAFDVPTSSDVTVRVYDVLGRQVATLTEGRISAGAYHVIWNAANQTSGMYFVRMDANGQAFTQKCLLIR